MGVLGANPQVPKSTLTGITGGENFTHRVVTQIRLLMMTYCERAGRTLTGQPTGGDPNNPLQKTFLQPKKVLLLLIKETMADKRKDAVLKKKASHILSRPTKTESSERNSNSYRRFDKRKFKETSRGY